MSTPSQAHPNADTAPLGATDQIEQMAADLAKKAGRSTVNDEDRQNAYMQMRKTAPPARSGPPSLSDA